MRRQILSSARESVGEPDIGAAPFEELLLQIASSDSLKTTERPRVEFNLALRTTKLHIGVEAAENVDSVLGNPSLERCSRT